MPTTWPMYGQRYGLAVALVALTGTVLIAIVLLSLFLSFLWPTATLANGPYMVAAGREQNFKFGKPVYFENTAYERKTRFWLVRQADGSFVAFSAVDNHPNGCGLEWQSGFDLRSFGQEPGPGAFRDRCTHSRFTIDGKRFFGPAPRNLDRYPVTIANGQVIVNTTPGAIIKSKQREVSLRR